MNIVFRSALALLAGSMAMQAPAALAQDRMNNVVVTAQKRVDNGNGEVDPQVFLRVPAEFVQFDLTCQSATRSVSDRNKELEAQFSALIAWDKDADKYELTGGEAGFEMIPIDTVSFREILQTQYNNTSRFNLVLLVDVDEGEAFDKLKSRANGALKAISSEGRVECYFGDDQYLGIRGLDAHRQDLLKAIATDAQLMNDVFGDGKIEITGLESRVMSRASGTLTMDVFIPYTMSIEVDD